MPSLISTAARLNLLTGVVCIGFGAWILLSIGGATPTTSQKATEHAVDRPADPVTTGMAVVKGFGEAVGAGAGEALAVLVGIVGAMSVAGGFLYLIVGLGIFRRSGWARILGILVGSFSLFLGVVLILLAAADRSAGPLLASCPFMLNGVVSASALIGGRAYAAYYTPAGRDNPWDYFETRSPSRSS